MGNGVGQSQYGYNQRVFSYENGSGHAPVSQSPEKLPEKKGLSAEELQKLPKTTAGGDKLIGTECAVCLDEIESGQPGRLLPGCNHGFHLHCADAWLSKNRICPLCRAILHPNEIINSDHDDSPC
ncbi:E3 ubiquitin-protein ligase ATL23-like [Macadamia integrifolia]|uniref:E3 ubiquitin-protein ligase ATL23-like n=1 Tax=Macadamia integrifolia TaxID=60698 RepID=UPI001C4F0FEB|nr:E3 ubiquitin-protein ligase ATL23-like [Macadamia integrifolia]